MDVQTLGSWIAVASSIGAIPLLIWSARWQWTRRRWIRFEKLIDAWIKKETTFPGDLSESGWKILCAIQMSEARFTPKEINEYLEVAVLIAKGRASLLISDDISKFT